MISSIPRDEISHAQNEEESSAIVPSNDTARNYHSTPTQRHYFPTQSIVANHTLSDRRNPPISHVSFIKVFVMNKVKKVWVISSLIAHGAPTQSNRALDST